MTNGVPVAAQQAGGLADISTQVQQYQQFLGERPPNRAYQSPASVGFSRDASQCRKAWN